MDPQTIINFDNHPIIDQDFRSACRGTLNRDGVLVLPNFLRTEAIGTVLQEGNTLRPQAYFCRQEHTVYLSPPSSDFPADHPRNRMVISSKGCITDDVVPRRSPLRFLYNDDTFKDFLCEVLNEKALYPYADPLSSINLHYADPGQELGWHFDNSAFAITLMIQQPERGGDFEYVGNMRDADRQEMNFEGVEKVLNGEIPANQLNMNAGALVLFRGRNAIHRVSPVEGQRTRMLVVLAYNAKSGISLEETARMTFYGRLS